jgi:hypothetical protein
MLYGKKPTDKTRVCNGSHSKLKTKTEAEEPGTQNTTHTQIHTQTQKVKGPRGSPSRNSYLHLLSGLNWCGIGGSIFREWLVVILVSWGFVVW